MNGIENIITAILAEAEGKKEQILSQARTEAEAISKRYEKTTAERVAKITAEGEAETRLIRERVLSNTELEARNHRLKAKQQVIDEAFQAAALAVRNYDAQQMSSLLAKLAAQAAIKGDEQVIFSAEHKAAYGAQVVEAANGLLSQSGRTAQLKLAAETREIGQGLVLKQGQIEISCIPEKLIWAQREALALEIAAILFPEA